MLLRNILTCFCLLCAGLANGTMDTISFHYSKTPYANAQKFDQQFWNPQISWVNKYKDGKVERGEKFPFSSTALVFTTDAWHLFKFFMLKCFILAILLAQSFSYRNYTFFGFFVLNAFLFLTFHASFALGFKIAYY